MKKGVWILGISFLLAFLLGSAAIWTSTMTLSGKLGFMAGLLFVIGFLGGSYPGFWE